jgi:hypothetical protein
MKAKIPCILILVTLWRSSWRSRQFTPDRSRGRWGTWEKIYTGNQPRPFNLQGLFLVSEVHYGIHRWMAWLVHGLSTRAPFRAIAELCVSVYAGEHWSFRVSSNVKTVVTVRYDLKKTFVFEIFMNVMNVCTSLQRVADLLSRPIRPV